MRNHALMVLRDSVINVKHGYVQPSREFIEGILDEARAG
jgi:hypothetical protein